LRALADAPSAFGSTYERDAALPDSEWQARARNGAISEAIAIFVSERESSWDGCAGLLLRGEATGWLISMWVAPQSRGQGVGESLINAVVSRARSLGLASLRLHVNLANAYAIALYERCGFTDTGVILAMERDNSIIEAEMSLAI